MAACAGGRAREVEVSAAGRDGGADGEGATVEIDGGTPDGAVAVTAPPAGFVDVVVAIPDAVLDLRYATTDNVVGVALYAAPRCWLRAEAATRLAAAAATLRARGWRLVLWDCYRPASVQRALWAHRPDPAFVARPVFDADGRPLAGSVHSRGGAIDVSLADLDGRPLAMPTAHDDFSPAASGAAARGPARDHLRALRAALTSSGFHPIASEWWHFEATGGAGWSLVDEPLR